MILLLLLVTKKKYYKCRTWAQIGAETRPKSCYPENNSVTYYFHNKNAPGSRQKNDLTANHQIL